MGSDESLFNVSLIVRDKVVRRRPQTIIFEEKGEPKRIRTEVPLALLTGLTPYRWAKRLTRKRLARVEFILSRLLTPIYKERELRTQNLITQGLRF